MPSLVTRPLVWSNKFGCLVGWVLPMKVPKQDRLMLEQKFIILNLSVSLHCWGQFPHRLLNIRRCSSCGVESSIHPYYSLFAMIMHTSGYDKPRPHITTKLSSVKCKSKNPEISLYTWKNGYNNKKNYLKWCHKVLRSCANRKSSFIAGGNVNLYKHFENQFDIF